MKISTLHSKIYLQKQRVVTVPAAPDTSSEMLLFCKFAFHQSHNYWLHLRTATFPRFNPVNILWPVTNGFSPCSAVVFKNWFFQSPGPPKTPFKYWILDFTPKELFAIRKIILGLRILDITQGLWVTPVLMSQKSTHNMDILPFPPRARPKTKQWLMKKPGHKMFKKMMPRASGPLQWQCALHPFPT